MENITRFILGNGLFIIGIFLLFWAVKRIIERQNY